MISIKRVLWSLCTFLAVASLFTGCDDEEAVEQQGYGYVQFHIYKKASYTKAENELDYLSDAAKLKVTLRTESNDILTPTVTVDYNDKALAEYGMQSDKFQLVAGNYTVVSYQILDVLDNPIFTGSPEDDSELRVIPGGLVSKDLLVNTVERGTVNFTLTKIDPISTKAGGVDEHPFYKIQSVDVTVRNKFSHEQMVVRNLKTTHEFIHSEDDFDYYTAVCYTDSLVSIKGGTWEVISFTTYFDRARKVYETCRNVENNSFVVKDNELTEADVPVKLDLSSEYLQDAMAIKEIWEALDGPNWKVKWEFNADVDIWTAQPGIQILDDGRVAALDFTNTGAKGDMPAALGKLTSLRSLILGSESFSEGSAVSPAKKYNEFDPENRISLKDKFNETFVSNSDPLTCFSDEMRLAFEIDGIELHKSGKPLRSYPLADIPVEYATGITSLPDEINNLKNLTALYMGYGPMRTLPEDMSGLESLTDVDIFFMPEMREFPAGLATLPKLQILVFGCNYGVPEDAMYEGLKTLNAGAAAKEIQGLYVPMQKLKKVPDMRNMVKLALLNIQQCGVEEFEAPFGKKHYFNSMLADNNNLSSLPVDEDGYFIGVDNNTETINFSYNKFKELPDIFDASSIFSFKTLDFSYNQIEKFGSYDGSGWRGVNCEIVNLSYNRLSEFPEGIAKSKSKMSFLQLQGNGIEKVSEEALKGENLYYIQSIDLSRNKLSELPSNFNQRTFPYLSGLDLSYNRFASFPYVAVNNQSLHVLIFRNQRDANGNRCMREWPSGIGSALFGLRALYLGSNDIRVVDDELSYLIYNLDISDNPNITIDISNICPYIAARAFVLIYSKGQDIRGCDDYLDL